jgi:hypothetical protein
MLIGYVTNEMYEALHDVQIAFHRDGTHVTTVHSEPTGAIHADVSSGRYEVVLAKDGYGKKRSTVEIGEDRVHDLRLLRSRPLGYIWPKWCRAGETAEYRLHTPQDTRLTLWRYGAEKELVRKITWHDEHGPHSCLQRLPDGDFVGEGVGWNETGYELNDPHSQTITAPERSGLYYLHMETADEEFFSFPWIVSPKTPQTRIAIVAATNTWNAYNSFGGRSNYVNTTGLPDRPIVEPRRELDRFQHADTWSAPDKDYEPLSFERPCPFNSIPLEQSATDPIRGKEAAHTAPAEWRFLSWLERNDYEHDLYADHQLHDGTLELDSYDILVVHTHPEYWSQEMYEQVRAWVFEESGHLLYLGGNGINCEIEFDDPTRIRVNNNTRDIPDIVHPRELPEGAFESRFHRQVESEGNLLGVVFTPSGIKTAAPYEVERPDHWVFDGTGLDDGDLFGTETLQERCPGGASGHETDKVSQFAPDNTQRLAKGLNPESGGAELVLYEIDSGGATFSAGSITYPAALLVDEPTSRITKNVLDRFLSRTA